MNLYECKHGLVINLPTEPKPDGEAHLILVIDNQSFVHYLKYLFPKMASLITDRSDALISFSIIETYPKVLLTDVPGDQIYNQFRKIHLQPDMKDTDLTKVMELIVGKVDDIRKGDQKPIEVIFLRKHSLQIQFSGEAFGQIVTNLNTLGVRLYIVTMLPYYNENLYTHPNVTGVLNKTTFPVEFLHDKLFGMAPINLPINKKREFLLKNSSKIGSDDTLIRGDSVMIQKPSNDTVDIVVNEKILSALTSSAQPCKDDILVAALENTIVPDTKLLQDYDWIREYLVTTISSKDVHVGVKNHAIVVYSKLKECLKQIKDQRVQDIVSSQDPADQDKYFAEYAKRAKKDSSNYKYQHRLDKTSLENLTLLETSSQIKKVLESPRITSFIDDIEKEEDNAQYKESVEIFNSGITLSNWFDEFQDGGALGLLIKLSSSPLAKLGVGSNINILEITTTFMPVVDYVDGAINFFNKQSAELFGDLNRKEIIRGTGIGSGNAIVPLYINRYHWSIAKLFLPQILGIIISHNPLHYRDGHQKFMFTILLDMTVKTHISDCHILSERWIRCLSALHRTCAEICFENKYSYGLKTYIGNYLSNPYRRISKNSFEYLTLLGQIFSTGYRLEDGQLVQIIKYILEDLIRMIGSNVNAQQFDKNPQKVVTRMEEILRYDLKVLVSFVSVYNVFQNLYQKLGGYNKYIKHLERHYGVLPDDLTKFLFEEIKKNGFSADILKFSDVYTALSIPYEQSDILWYIDQGSKQWRNKVRKEAVQKGEYIDIQKTPDANIYQSKI